MTTKEKRSIFYVYMYYDEKGVPFYVGKGYGDRYKAHTKLKARNKITPVQRKVVQLVNRGLKPTIHIWHKNLLEDQAFLYEKILIKVLGRRDLQTGPLLNLTDGGEGLSNRRRITLEERMLASKRTKEWSSKRMPEQIAERNRRFSESMKNRLPEQKAETTKKKQIAIQNKTPEELAEWKRKLKESVQNRSPEAVAHRKKKLSEVFSRKSLDDQNKFRDVSRKHLLNYISSLTPEQEIERRKKLSEAGKRDWEKRKQNSVLYEERKAIQKEAIKKYLESAEGKEHLRILKEITNTPEQRKQQSERTKSMWADAEIRGRLLNGKKNIKFSEEAKLNIKASWTPERKAKNGARMRAAWADPEARKNMIEKKAMALAGQVSPNKRKPRSEETKRKLSERIKQVHADPEKKKRIVAAAQATRVKNRLKRRQRELEEVVA